MLPRDGIVAGLEHLLGRLCLAVALFGVALSAIVGTGVAQPVSSPEDLTQSLIALGLRHRAAGAAHQAHLLGQLVSVATARQQQLVGLMESDPGTVLRVAMPASVRAGLPSAVQALVEEEVQIDGTLEVLHEDRGGDSRYRHFLETAAGRLSLHFAAETPALETGARVRVRGVRLGDALALSSDGTSVQLLAPAVPNTFGEQKTLVILVNFQDKATQPYTPSYAQNVVFGTTSNFDLENSYGQTWLAGNVYGWFTIPISSTICDPTAIATSAKQAAQAAGADLSAYTRYVYAFPTNACTWWGRGSVGGKPSQAWINGSLTVKVVSHEMGHNFGLYHSHAIECGSSVTGTGCSSVEYGDTLDTMGNPTSGHFNAFQKERLGWLGYGASPPLTTVQADGVYTLEPYETSTGLTPKALKVLQSVDPATGKKTWYYIEYRQGLGFDGFVASNANVTDGIVIHRASEASADSCYLLDLTPATTSWSDPALTVGQSYYDPDAGVTIIPMWTESTGAGVSISLGPLACVRGIPAVALAPSGTRWVSPGSTVTYTVTVTNTDNSGCAASVFGLAAPVPGGWSAAFGTSALTASPGASALTTLAITSAAASPEGFYTIRVTVTNTADNYTSSTTATLSLVSSLDVDLATDRPSYARNAWVAITASVSQGGSPVAGAAVSFTVTKPSGTAMTGSATTDSAGVAVFRFRLKQREPAGTYQVTAHASLNGTVFGDAVASFPVQ